MATWDEATEGTADGLAPVGSWRKDRASLTHCTCKVRKPSRQRVLSPTPDADRGGLQGWLCQEGPVMAMVSKRARTSWVSVTLPNGQVLPGSPGGAAPVQGAGRPPLPHTPAPPDLTSLAPEEQGLRQHRGYKSQRDSGTQEADEGDSTQPRDHPVETGLRGVILYHLLRAQACRGRLGQGPTQSLCPSPRSHWCQSGF